MKTIITTFKHFMLGFSIITLLISITSCEQEELGIANAGPSFDLDLFEQNIKDALQNHSVGFAYAINEDGSLAREDALGAARTSTDGFVSMSVNTPINVASVSKTITTVAALRAIQDNSSIDIDDPIYPYLPNSWELGPGMNAVTFRELLAHTSGIKFKGGFNEQAYGYLQKIVEEGVTGPKTYSYSNVGISLFRILIPNMLGGVVWTPNLTVEEAYAAVYEAYVKEIIFAPMGLTKAYLDEPENIAYLYHYPDGNASGIHTGDWTLYSGAGGWSLSAHELARFIAHVRYNNEVLSPSSREIMNSDELGWTETLTGDHGTYLAKGGSLDYDSPNKGVRTLIINFPYGIQASVVINSAEGAGYNLHGTLRDAYDNAWH